MKQKILIEELSIGNLVEYNGRIGCVVAIPNEKEIMWSPNDGGGTEKVGIEELESVSVSPDRFVDYIVKKHPSLREIPGEKNKYEFDVSQGNVETFRCYIEVCFGAVHFLVWDEDCTIPMQKNEDENIKEHERKKVFCKSVVYIKMHSLQNFITSLVSDLAGGIK